MSEKRSLRRRWILGGLLAIAVVGIFYLWPLIMLQIDEDATPSLDKGDIPAGIVVTRTTTECGSGGCWLEVTFDREFSEASALEELSTFSTTCKRTSFFDLRRVCTYVDPWSDDRISIRYKPELDW